MYNNYVAAVCQPLGVCIWNLWSSNLVAEMHCDDATTVALATVSDTCAIAAVGCNKGCVLVFMS